MTGMETYPGGVGQVPPGNTPAGFMVGAEKLPPAKLRLAQLAGGVFLQAFDPSGRYGCDDYEPYKGKFEAQAERALAQAVSLYGVEIVAGAFQSFRQLHGEKEYEGVQIEPSESKSQTRIFEYLVLVQQKRLIINQWLSRHDEREHLAGGLLATAEVADVLSDAAGFALEGDMPDRLRMDIGIRLDFAFSYIRRMWLDQPHAERHTRGLAEKLVESHELSGHELAAEDAQAIANRQLRTIRDWRYRASLSALALGSQ